MCNIHPCEDSGCVLNEPVIGKPSNLVVNLGRLRRSVVQAETGDDLRPLHRTGKEKSCENGEWST